VLRSSRRFALLVSLFALASTGVVAGVTSAGAGVVGGAAPLTILKTVTGTVPAGTTFTVALECSDGAEIDDGDGGTTSATVTFDAAGQPTSPDTFTFSDGPGLCVVSETVSGGASSTTYACEGSYPDTPEEPAVPEQEGGFSAEQVAPGDPVCPAAGPQAAPITVNIVTPSQDATVTVHNTFDDPAPAPQVIARPAFTG
jgi:hypothetical protein